MNHNATDSGIPYDSQRFWAYSDTYDGLIKLLDAKSHFSYRIVSLAGILLCYAWYRLVRSYKDINSGKFKVVHEIEKELPLAPYDAEWEAVGRGKDPKLYLPFINIEMWIPKIFGSLHAIVLLLSVPWDSLLSSLPQS